MLNNISKIGEDKWVLMLSEKLNSTRYFQKEELKASVKINLPYVVNLSNYYDYDVAKSGKRNVKVEGIVNSYQIDLMIFKKNRPMIAIECKMNSINTQSFNVYSDNAERHKKIFKDLKYGLIIANNNKGANTFESKIFMHANNFDFLMCLDKKLEDENLWETFINVIKNQLSTLNEKNVYCIEKIKTHHSIT